MNYSEKESVFKQAHDCGSLNDFSEQVIWGKEKYIIPLKI